MRAQELGFYSGNHGSLPIVRLDITLWFGRSVEDVLVRKDRRQETVGLDPNGPSGGETEGGTASGRLRSGSSARSSGGPARGESSDRASESNFILKDYFTHSDIFRR